MFYGYNRRYLASQVLNYINNEEHEHFMKIFFNMFIIIFGWFVMRVDMSENIIGILKILLNP